MHKILRITLLLSLALLLFSSNSLFAQNWWGTVGKQFPAQTDFFTIEFDLVPRDEDSGVARAHITLSDSVPGGWGDNACIIRFVVAAEGELNYVDVRNGGTYEADEFYDYYEGVTYHCKMEVDPVSDFYSVYVKELPDGEEVLLKDGSSFRTDQAGVGRLQYINVTIPYADSANGINDPGAELKNIVMKNLDGEVIWEDAGTGEETSIETNPVNAPVEFNLAQNYPNPFNPSTTIPFSMTKTGHVTIAVYNTIGQKMITLVDDFRSDGEYQVNWNGTNNLGEKLSSGIYFIRMTTDNFSYIQKALLVQ